MKRKYPKDDDTVKTIKEWLTKNKVDYKWKTKRKPELLEITHLAIVAVKKRNKQYAKVPPSEIPNIIIKRNDKDRLVAAFHSSNTPTKDKDKQENKNKTDVVRNAIAKSHHDTDQNDNTELIKKIIQQTHTKENESSSYTDNTAQPSTQNINRGIKLDLANDEWLLIAKFPKDLPADAILDLATGEVYADDDTPDNKDNATTVSSDDVKNNSEQLTSKTYQLNADTVDIYNPATNKQIVGNKNNDKTETAKEHLSNSTTVEKQDDKSKKIIKVATSVILIIIIIIFILSQYHLF